MRRKYIVIFYTDTRSLDIVAYDSWLSDVIGFSNVKSETKNGHQYQGNGSWFSYVGTPHIRTLVEIV